MWRAGDGAERRHHAAMARYAARHASTGDPVRDEVASLTAWRDRITTEWLQRTVSISGVVDYDAEWWDGQAYDRCLVVEAGGRKLRVVDVDGDPVVVPFRRRKAGRLLAERRRSSATEPGEALPRQRRPVVRIEAVDDVIRCSGASCGALVPVATGTTCPRCGQHVQG